MLNDCSEFPDLLRQRLWHTTNEARYEAIVESGCILPEPPIPDSERWCTSEGPGLYPYARSIGGVSLFDFRDFDAERYEREYPISNWSEFIPYRDEWGVSLWLEIDRDSISTGLVDGAELLDRWRSERAYKRRIMPEIEGAHVGPLSIQAVRAVYRAGRGINGFQRIHE